VTWLLATISDNFNYRTSNALANSNNSIIIITMPSPAPTASQKPSLTPYRARSNLLQARVNNAAQTLHTQGIRPTVTRIRAALGGGSPNDLTPALKHWKESILPTLPATNPAQQTNLTATPPAEIADLTRELWRRALTTAAIELKAGPSARQTTAHSEEVLTLRTQLASLRAQLEKELLTHGELHTQATRHEVIAREALARAQASDARERTLLREVGALRQRVTELEATERYLRTTSRPRPKIAIRRGAPTPKRPRIASKASDTTRPPRPMSRISRKSR
jgi:Plasmid replication region DNA-binding N-term